MRVPVVRQETGIYYRENACVRAAGLQSSPLRMFLLALMVVIAIRRGPGVTAPRSQMMRTPMRHL